MIWMVFRNKWFALAWVAMVCAGIGLRFGLSAYLFGGDPVTALGGGFASSASEATGAPESTVDQENKARRELEQKQSERATTNDADRPTVNVE